jgi:hypothetical protein
MAIAGCEPALTPIPPPPPVKPCTDLAKLRLDTRAKATADEHRAAFAGYEQLLECGDTDARVGLYVEACHLHDLVRVRQLYRQLLAEHDWRLDSLRQICMANAAFDPASE